MEADNQRFAVLDRDADPESYFRNLSDEDLIKIIRDFEDFEDVSSALTELAARNKRDAVTEYTYKILNENLGDDYLQAIAFNLLYGKNVEKAFEIINLRLANALPSLFGEILDNLSSNNSQSFESSLDRKFLKSIADRFLDYKPEEQKRINDDYQYFIESFEDKLS